MDGRTSYISAILYKLAGVRVETCQRDIQKSDFFICVLHNAAARRKRQSKRNEHSVSVRGVLAHADQGFVKFEVLEIVVFKQQPEYLLLPPASHAGLLLKRHWQKR